jgi:hypothetical protein
MFWSTLKATRCPPNTGCSFLSQSAHQPQSIIVEHCMATFQRRVDDSIVYVLLQDMYVRLSNRIFRQMYEAMSICNPRRIVIYRIPIFIRILRRGLFSLHHNSTWSTSLLESVFYLPGMPQIMVYIFSDREQWAIDPFSRPTSFTKTKMMLYLDLWISAKFSHIWFVWLLWFHYS